MGSPTLAAGHLPSNPFLLRANTSIWRRNLQQPHCSLQPGSPLPAGRRLSRLVIARLSEAARQQAPDIVSARLHDPQPHSSDPYPTCASSAPPLCQSVCECPLVALFQRGMFQMQPCPAQCTAPLNQHHPDRVFALSWTILGISNWHAAAYRSALIFHPTKYDVR